MRIYEIRLALSALFDTVNQINLGGKPTVLALINQADDHCVALLRKCARKAVINAARQHYYRLNVPAALMDELTKQAQTIPPPKNGRPRSEDPAKRALRTHKRKIALVQP